MLPAKPLTLFYICCMISIHLFLQELNILFGGVGIRSSVEEFGFCTFFSKRLGIIHIPWFCMNLAKNKSCPQVLITTYALSYKFYKFCLSLKSANLMDPER
jgi:hypothetical protein